MLQLACLKFPYSEKNCNDVPELLKLVEKNSDDRNTLSNKTCIEK